MKTSSSSTASPCRQDTHKVAVIDYMSKCHVPTWSGGGDKSGTSDVHSYILNAGRLQATYIITGGKIAPAIAYPDGRWAGCTWNLATRAWECGE